jgi:hypothetical protein
MSWEFRTRTVERRFGIPLRGNQTGALKPNWYRSFVRYHNEGFRRLRNPGETTFRADLFTCF